MGTRNSRRNSILVYVGFTLTLFCALLFVSFAYANSAGTYKLQGTLKNTSDRALNGSYDVVFEFFEASTSSLPVATAFFTASSGNSLLIKEGDFSITLKESLFASTSSASKSSFFVDVIVNKEYRSESRLEVLLESDERVDEEGDMGLMDMFRQAFTAKKLTLLKSENGTKEPTEDVIVSADFTSTWANVGEEVGVKTEQKRSRASRSEAEKDRERRSRNDEEKTSDRTELSLISARFGVVGKTASIDIQEVEMQLDKEQEEEEEIRSARKIDEKLDATQQDTNPALSIYRYHFIVDMPLGETSHSATIEVVADSDTENTLESKSASSTSANASSTQSSNQPKPEVEATKQDLQNEVSEQASSTVEALNTVLEQFEEIDNATST